jgi:very-short-patch-repair endonuclease
VGEGVFVLFAATDMRKKGLRNQKTLNRARELRRDSTIPERMLWNVLRAGRLGGLKFRRQHPVGPYFVDYVCEEEHLAAELDGESHVGRAEYDAERSRYLEQRGYRVLRVGNDDVLTDIEAVGLAILKACGRPLPGESPKSPSR